jgi:hypothetical protein
VTATPTGLPGFLTARVSDWEREAPDIHRSDCESVQYDYGGVALGPCECGVPARVLADCAFKRGLVEDAQRALSLVDENGRGRSGDQDVRAQLESDADMWLHDVLRPMAQLWADHPAFNPSWRA